MTRTSDQQTLAELFERYRRHLFGVAYRMLGSAQDAEDVVQDAWLRFAEVDADAIESPRGYLVTIVVRLCLDVLKSARRQREEYVGPWLPEPVRAEALTDETSEVVARVETASLTFLWLLERLSPLERAVVVLHEGFDYDHAEIGAIVGRSAVASRQVLRRARRRLEAARAGEGIAPVQRPSEHHRELTERFVRAATTGDLDGLLELLAEDIVLVADGGGRVPSATNPVSGRSHVVRLLAGWAAKDPPVHAEIVALNDRPAILTRSTSGITTLVLIDGDEAGRVRRLWMVRNPTKTRAFRPRRRGAVPPTA